MIDTKDGFARLLEFVPHKTLPAQTLLDLTADRSYATTSRHPSGLEERVAQAWVTPLQDITCGQCRMLVGQQLGLRWLAEPVAAFVTLYPRAECDLYPGDLSVISLVEWRELIRYARPEAVNMLAVDFEWLKREADADDWPKSITKEAVRELEHARRELGIMV